MLICMQKQQPYPDPLMAFVVTTSQGEDGTIFNLEEQLSSSDVYSLRHAAMTTGAGTTFLMVAACLGACKEVSLPMRKGPIRRSGASSLRSPLHTLPISKATVCVLPTLQAASIQEAMNLARHQAAISGVCELHLRSDRHMLRPMHVLQCACQWFEPAALHMPIPSADLAGL